MTSFFFFISYLHYHRLGQWTACPFLRGNDIWRTCLFFLLDTCWNVICSYSPVFLLVVPEVWTPSGGLLTPTHSGLPSGQLAH